MMVMAFEFWTNFSNGMVEYAMDAFSNVEPWTFPLIFMGIIGFVYSATHSVVTSVIAILITFGLYAGAAATDVFADVPDVSLFMYIIALVGISALVFTLFARKVVK